MVPRTYLDSTASALKIGPVRRAEAIAERVHANTHSQNFAAARRATKFYGLSHGIVLDFFGADPQTHTAIYSGSGATGAINHAANTLLNEQVLGRKPARPVVISPLIHVMAASAPNLIWLACLIFPNIS